MPTTQDQADKIIADYEEFLADEGIEKPITLGTPDTASIPTKVQGDCSLVFGDLERYIVPAPPDAHLRGTGRTHRMLECAITQAQQGASVMVYYRDKDGIRASLDEVFKITKSSVQPIITTGGVTIPIGHGSVHLAELPREFDWYEMRARGTRKDIVILVDHAAIEDEFRLMTEMLHRFIAVNVVGVIKETK